jgi:hypothetical protein
MRPRAEMLEIENREKRNTEQLAANQSHTLGPWDDHPGRTGTSAAKCIHCEMLARLIMTYYTFSIGGPAVGHRCASAGPELIIKAMQIERLP